MYAFECVKSNLIIYNNLVFNKYQEIQDDYPSQLFWPQNCVCYVTNYFESTSTVIYIKKRNNC